MMIPTTQVDTGTGNGRGRSRKRTRFYETLHTYHQHFLHRLTLEYEAEEFIIKIGLPIVLSTLIRFDMNK
jgi:hypothetical protein